MSWSVRLLFTNKFIMSFEPQSDDAVLMDSNKSLTGAKISRVKDIDQGFKDRLKSSASADWFNQGIGCELLNATTGGGWQKGKIRIREVCLHFEFVPDEPEPSPDSNALAPLSESVNPE